MSYTMNFRSALNGFNRDDVVNYISYLNNKHTSEVSALNNEKKGLEDRLAQIQEEARNQQQTLQATVDELRTRLEEAAAWNEVLEKEMQDLSVKKDEPAEEQPAPDSAELAELRARCAALQEQLHRVQTGERAAQSRSMEQELEAYRRAERTERVARERAELIYRQASSAIDGAADKVDAAFTMISELSDQVSAQLSQLHGAISGSKHALADAVTTLYTIRPEDTVR